MKLSLVLCVVMIGFSRGQQMFSNAGAWPSEEEIQADKKEGGMLEALMGSVAEDCYGRRCGTVGDCCQGSLCVDIDGVSGTCLPVYGKKAGEPCNSNSDCETGMICSNSQNTEQPKTCQVEGRDLKKKAYNDECVTSAECETAKGLCCQVLRRHRMAPKKVCHYFIDPQSCIGKLETNMKPLHYIPNPFFKARLG